MDSVVLILKGYNGGGWSFLLEVVPVEAAVVVADSWAEK